MVVAAVWPLDLRMLSRTICWWSIHFKSQANSGSPQDKAVRWGPSEVGQIGGGWWPNHPVNGEVCPRCPVVLDY